MLSSGVLVIALLPWLWRTRRTRLLGLFAVAVPALIGNAFVTAVFSGISSRYQSRVIWLVPLLAGLSVLDYLGCRKLRAVESTE